MINEEFEKAKKSFEEGIKYFQEDKFDLAERSFLTSLELLPNRLSTISNLIKLYIKTNKASKLSEILEKYDQFKDDKNMLLGLAYKYHFEKKIKESVGICNVLINDNDLKISIQDLMALNYKSDQKFLSALKIYKNRIRENRKNFLTFYNTGCLFFDLGKINQAIYFFKKSINLNPKDNRTLWNLSLCALTKKELKYGFELYEYRWEKENSDKKKFEYIDTPESIEQIIDKKILIWDEQGLGDAINFSRFVIEVLNFTSKVTLVVNKKIKDILVNLNSKIEVIDYENLKEQQFDFQLPICSLPKILKIASVKEINFYQLYLKNKTPISKDIKKDQLNIGLAWSGNPNYAVDEYRSISFKNFKTILNLGNINFFKLSQNIKEDELVDYNSSKNILDYGKKSLFEVANIMEHLDLVISSDTSIIHLAGILNVKSILLLNYNSDWRWFNDKEKTIWYPAVKIIKQKKFDTWDSVFEELNKEIKKRAVKTALFKINK